MPLSLPVYFRGRTFVLHTRINGRHFKRSLKTADPRVATLRAIQLLRAAQMAIKGDIPDLSEFDLDPAKLRKYKVNPSTGAMETDGTQQDHDNMMAAIDRIGMIPGGWPKTPSTSGEAAVPISTTKKQRGNTFTDVLAEYKTLKSGASAGTITDYSATVAEFEKFAKKPAISEVSEDTISDYMRWLAKQGNKEPTIDKKIGALRAMFNFGKKHKLCHGDNPAADRNLQSRDQKNAGGHKFYELDEIKQVLGCVEFKAMAETQANFYLIMVAALITGIRITALAALRAEDFRVSIGGNPYIRVLKDKTAAGKRNVPIPKTLHDSMRAYLAKHADFGFDARSDGKGASDPVRKELQTHLANIKATGDGFTVHGLRKTLNSYFHKNRVQIEERCQFMGHKIDHVNVGVYTPGHAVEKLTLDDIANAVTKSQLELMAMIEFVAMVEETPPSLATDSVQTQ